MRRRAGKVPDPPAGYPDVTSAPAPSTEQRQHAFRVHVQPEIEVLLRVARTLTGSWADAEDLVQDTLIRAYRGIGGFDGRYPRAWLLTILRHTHINSVRRQRPALLAQSADLDGYRPAFGTPTVAGTEDTVTDRYLDEHLDAALAGLDERFRVVLLLVDVDQLSYAEAAELLGIPVGTVMSRLSRARDRVRTALAAHPHLWRNR